MDIMNIELDKNLKLDRGAWLNLLGVSDAHIAEAQTNEKLRATLDRQDEQMKEAQGLLLDAAKPSFAYAVVDCSTADGGNAPEGQDAEKPRPEAPEVFSPEGTSLVKHLEGCSQVVLMAVTLGPGVDKLIEDTLQSKIALGVVVDCGASVMAELAADMATDRIREELAQPATESANQPAANSPVFMTSRFSPGYGDSPLQLQEEILSILNADKRLGISLSDAFMMRPSKSITGIIGLADHPVKGRLATCAECVLRDKCQLKKEGKRCYDTSH